MTLVCKIGANDYGDRLLQLDIEASGHTTVGTARLLFRKTSGGLDIRNKYPVEIYEDDGAGITPISHVWFGGVIAFDGQYNDGLSKYDEVRCTDQNIYLDQDVSSGVVADEIVVETAILPTQITDIITTLQNQGGAPAVAINSTAFVDNITGATNLSHARYKGKSLRQMLQHRAAEVQRRVPASRPRFAIAPSRTFPRASFGDPHLYFWDAAVTTSPVYHFSDAPTGAQRHIYDFERPMDGQYLVNRRQLMATVGAAVYTAQDAASIALYPNPTMGHGGWSDIPVEDTQGLDATEGQAAIDRIVAQTAYPRETVTFQVDKDIRVNPGQVVTLTHSLFGISAVNYRVVAVSIRWDPDTRQPEIWLTLNTRRLQLFEEGDEGIDAPPVEIDVIPPNPPTSLSVLFNVWDAERGAPVRRISFTASTSADVAGYEVYDTVGGETLVENIGLATTYDLIHGQGGLSYSTYVLAYDSSPRRNLSEPSNTVSGTTAAPITWPYVPNASFEEIDQSTAPQSPPRWWSEVGVVGAGTSGTSTAQFLGGERSMIFITTNTTDEVKRRSAFIDAQPSTNYNVRVPNRGSVASNALYVAIEWYQGGSLVSTTVLKNDGPVTTSWQISGANAEWQTTSPANIDKMKVVIGVVSPSVAGSVYVDLVLVDTQIRTPEIEDSAITNAKLGIITLATKINPDIETNSLIFEKANGDPAETITYSAGDQSVGYAVDVALRTLGGLTRLGGIGHSHASHTTNVTLSRSVVTNFANANGGAITLTLPASSNQYTGTTFFIMKTDSTTNTVTVDPNGAETINGALTFVLKHRYESIYIVSDGSNWFILEHQPTPYDHPFFTHDAGVPPYSNNGNVASSHIHGDYALYLHRFTVSWLMAAPHDGSNYWTIDLHRVTSGGTDTIIATVVTDKATNSAWVQGSDTSFAVNPLAITDTLLYVVITKTGSPGFIYPIPGLKVSDIPA